MPVYSLSRIFQGMVRLEASPPSHHLSHFLPPCPPSTSFALCRLIHLLALLYVSYTIVFFNLPVEFPVTKDTFNYSPVGVGAFVFVFVTWWLADARRWFRGPVSNLER